MFKLLTYDEIKREMLKSNLIRWSGLTATLGFNILAWIGAWLWPDSPSNGVWTVVSLLGAFLTGALIGRWWAFALTILLALTGLGVISHRAIRWAQSRFAS